MPVPVDVPTRETLQFVTSHVPSGASLLEVGCGEGELAHELQRVGYRVLGLESDPERAALTSRRGVPSVLAAWPEFESATPFDAIAFTRSLHHIDPLRDAVRHARKLLKSDGVLILEDFAVHDIRRRDMEWLQTIIRSAGPLLIDAPDELVTQARDARDPFEIWTERHDHVHRFDAIEQLVREEFRVTHASTVPYFYRYFVYVLPPTEAAAGFLDRVFEEESKQIREGGITGLGRRIVGTPSPKARSR